jgi:metal-responsive CopG/Arc/MetJ family transcriptional regulator
MGRSSRAGQRDRVASWERVMVNLDVDLVAWLDAEAAKRDRSRAWMVNHVCRMYRRQLERERKRRADRRA